MGFGCVSGEEISIPMTPKNRGFGSPQKFELSLWRRIGQARRTDALGSCDLYMGSKFIPGVYGANCSRFVCVYCGGIRCYDSHAGIILLIFLAAVNNCIPEMNK